MASVSIGRNRFPPEEIRWLATSGIMVTSEPVRDRIVALTRSMSAATRPTSASIEAFDGLSKGTITATQVSTFAQYALSLTYNRKCRLKRQGDDAVDRRGTALASGMAHYFDAFPSANRYPLRSKTLREENANCGN